jgi:hypothetical protein
MQSRRSQFRGVHRWTEAVPSKQFPEQPRRCGFVALCDEPLDALSTVLERRAELTFKR